VLAYQDAEGYIEYGATDFATQTPLQSFGVNQPVEIAIDSLQPDTAYTYRVRYRAGNTSEFATTEAAAFHTQRAPGSAFTFTIQADSHLDSNSDLNVYTQTLPNQRAVRPDFTIDLGDTFMTDKYKPYTSAQPQYLAQRYYFSLLGQTSPLYLVLGNHDGEGAPRGGSANEMSTWSAQVRTTYFPNPVPDAFCSGDAQQSYYAWEWGDALFVVLDPYTFTPASRDAIDNWNATLGEAQYQWLKKTLESSDAKWKFVFIHQLVGGAGKDGRGGVEAAPYYEWGGQNVDGTDGFAQHRSGWPMPIHDLLVANHVTAVFHGHDHLFVKQDLDGIVYQEVPQPSSVRANATNSAADYGYVTGDVLGSPGHVRVTVAPDQVKIEYVRTYLPQDEKPGQRNGQVDYAYTITP
jgi:predicted phosphodiesterase